MGISWDIVNKLLISTEKYRMQSVIWSNVSRPQREKEKAAR
jgi:hypothetical protein